MKNSQMSPKKCTTLSTEIADLSFEMHENPNYLSMSLSGIDFGK